MLKMKIDIVVSACRTICNSVYTFLANFIIGPVVFLFLIPHALLNVPLANLFLEKACRISLTLNSTLCDSIATGDLFLSSHEEIELQRKVTTMLAWTSIIQGAVSGCLLLYVGAWSDRCDIRKPFIILPFISESIRVISCLFSTYYFENISLNWTGLMNSLFCSITGGGYLFLMAVYNYVSIGSTNETRTVQIGIINVCVQISITIGMGVGGLAYRKLSLKGTFWMCLSFYVIGIVYVLFCTKEISIQAKTQNEQYDKCKPECFTKIFTIVGDIKNTVMTVVQKRQNKLRFKICLNVVIVILINGVLQGQSLMYFLVRNRYKWNEIQYSKYATITLATSSIGSFFGLLLFAQYLNINDYLLAMFPCVLKIVELVILSLATNSETLLYMSITFGVFYGVTFVSIRSILTKLVSQNELGKINGIIGACQAFMPILFGPLFNSLYQYTVSIFDGIFLLAASSLLIPVIVILIWQYFRSRYESTIEKKIELK